MTEVLEAMAEAERKAWDSLSRYKFLMFGYHAAQWVTLRRLVQSNVDFLPNPWRDLVTVARDKREADRG